MMSSYVVLQPFPLDDVVSCVLSSWLCEGGSISIWPTRTSRPSFADFVSLGDHNTYKQDVGIAEPAKPAEPAPEIKINTHTGRNWHRGNLSSTTPLGQLRVFGTTTTLVWQQRRPSISTAKLNGALDRSFSNTRHVHFRMLTRILTLSHYCAFFVLAGPS
jgi:hypothetical protein